MVLKFIYTAIFLFSIISCSSKGTTGKIDDNQIQKKTTAQDLYIEHCSVCHGADGKLGAAGAKDITKSTLSSTEVQSRIEKGKNGMPPMKELLGSKKNITSVTEYVLRMR